MLGSYELLLPTFCAQSGFSPVFLSKVDTLDKERWYYQLLL